MGRPHPYRRGGYTNSSTGETVTTLYTVDYTSSAIYIQNPPNNGTQTGSVTILPNIYGIGGFDISPSVEVTTSNSAPASGSATVIANVVGDTAQSVASIDLVSGALTEIGALGDGDDTAIGLALQQPLDTSMIALVPGTNSILRFNLSTPGTTTTVAVTGVTSGETLVGIDYRPTTGQLFALGVDDAADTGTLYIIDPLSAAATAVGSASSIALVDSNAAAVDLPAVSTGYGFNFNPTVDRIRVVAGNGVNFRINPTNGTAVDSDGNTAGTNPDGTLNGATSAIQGASYTNSVGGATVTTLYTISATTNALYIQNPPNAGTQTGAVPVTLNGAALDFTAVGGFEIPTTVSVTTANAAVTAGTAYAVLTVGGVNNLYSIDLVTGEATLIGAPAGGATATSGLVAAIVTAK